MPVARGVGNIHLYNIGPEDRQIICRNPRCQAPVPLYSSQPLQTVQCRCGTKHNTVWYRPVADPKELQDYLLKAREAPSTSYDYETSGLNPYQNRIVGCSFCREDQPGIAIYVPIDHSVGDCMPFEVFREIAAPFIERTPMNAHYFDFEYRWTVVHLRVHPKVNCDTKIETWLDDSNRVWRYDNRGLGLKDTSRDILGIDVTDLDQLVDLKTQNFSYLPVNMAYPYGCQDSDLTTRLLIQFKFRNRQTQPLIQEIERRLIKITAKMELKGILLDPDLLEASLPAIEAEIEKLALETFELMGCKPPELPEDSNVVPIQRGKWVPPFDIDSPAQVAKALFKDVGIPFDPKFIGKPTAAFPDGQPSVSKKALEMIRDDFEVVDSYLKYKEAKHAKVNFIEKLPDKVEPTTGALHGHFNQTGTPHGRYSASGGFNLQAIVKVRD